MKSGIYKITNLITNLLYIGGTKNLDIRWEQHKYGLNSNTHKNKYLQSAWNEYGAKNFEFVVLELCLEEYLYEAEQWWLNQTKSYEKSIGYNLASNSIGGNGIEWTDVSRKEASELRKGNNAPKMRAKRLERMAEKMKIMKK